MAKEPFTAALKERKLDIKVRLKTAQETEGQPSHVDALHASRRRRYEHMISNLVKDVDPLYLFAATCYELGLF